MQTQLTLHPRDIRPDDELFYLDEWRIVKYAHGVTARATNFNNYPLYEFYLASNDPIFLFAPNDTRVEVRRRTLTPAERLEKIRREIFADRADDGAARLDKIRAILEEN